MTDEQRAARLFQTWLESEAPERAPAGLIDQITTATRSARPRPTWIARLEGHHVDVIQGGRRSSVPRLGLALAIIGLILAVAGAIAFVGSRQPDNVRPQASAAAKASASFVWPGIATQPGERVPSELIGAWDAYEFNEYTYFLPAGHRFCVDHWKTQQDCVIFATREGAFYRNADVVTMVDGKLRFWPIGDDRCVGKASLVTFQHTGDTVALTVEPNQCFTDMSSLRALSSPDAAPSIPPY
ncbi:MAG TPA: hypothetical protein VFJ80_02255 [Candidatus Limnocylindrales bacterium]|jgi:hypothetical protein|nr:hypothetical protein [Candidatus Limnocylindrales bacterium]